MAADNRPFYLLIAALVAVAVLFALPGSREVLVESVVEPLRAQVAPTPDLQAGYSPVSLAFWALLGGAIAWASYETVFVRARFEADRAFFLALSPALVFGPLLHALLAAGALPLPVAWQYLAAEPLVYLTAAAVAGVSLAAGRAARSAWRVPVGVGLLFLLPLLVWAAPLVDAHALRQAMLVLALAVVPAAALAWGYRRLRGDVQPAAAFAVIGAHALDGATTWMVLRDPFGIGFHGFTERNPVSEALVEMANGWPYFAVKLALPVVLLWLVKADEGQERTYAFLLFAIFVLGYGPGMSNLLQVILG